MWAMEKSFFEWKYRYPGKSDNFYLRRALWSRYPEKGNAFVADLAQRCRNLDDAILEAVRVDFGESVACKLKPALDLFPACSKCGVYRALSTRDTLCYGCRKFGNLIPCHKCHLYWDRDAGVCGKCGTPLIPTSGTEANQTVASRTADPRRQELANLEVQPPTKLPTSLISAGPFRPIVLAGDELVFRAVTLAVAGIWNNATEHDSAATILDILGTLARRGVKPEEVALQIFAPIQTFLMAQRAADFLSIQLDPAFSTFAQSNLERLYLAYLREGEAGFRRAWSSVFRSGWESHRPSESIVVCEGGDGRSEEDAVVLKPGDEDPETAVRAEYWYLSYVYGRRNSDWRKIQQDLIAGQNGKKYDDLLIELSNGERLNIFFDVTHMSYWRSQGPPNHLKQAI
jgi:hypothetical protein